MTAKAFALVNYEKRNRVARITINNAERMNARALSSDATARHTGWSSIRRTWLASQIQQKDARAARNVGKLAEDVIAWLSETAVAQSSRAQETQAELVLMHPLHASDLNNGTAKNPPLLQRNAGLLDLFQGISVGHQPP
jgi:hypothetical protein